MRLEDWQKWLDSQFMDAEEARKQAEASIPVDEPPVLHATLASPPPASIAPPAPGAGSQRLDAPESRAEPRETPSFAVKASPPPVTRNMSDVVDDIDVPSLERYLPFLRQSAPQTAQQTTEPLDAIATPEEPENGEESFSAAAAEAPAEEIGDTVAQAAEIGAAEQTAEAVELESAEEPEPPVALLAETPLSGNAEKHANGIVTQEPGQRERLAPASSWVRQRGRHARNVKPAEIVQELSDGGLWGLVPKHIQVLVAMGSEDVAQTSYKRSFKENRLELIDRLLDPTLSLEDTARLLNVCPTTVRRYTNRGLLTHQRTPGDQRRFRLSDVLAFLEAQSRAR